MTVAVALLLAAVTVLPLLAEARHEMSGPVAHAVMSVAGPDQGAAHREADDLIHHAQSHAQGVMPVAAKAPATVGPSAEQSFARTDEAFRAGEPRRVSPRPFGLGYAAKACASACVR